METMGKRRWRWVVPALLVAAVTAGGWLGGQYLQPASVITPAMPASAPLPFSERWQAVAPHLAVRALSWPMGEGNVAVAVVRADLASCTVRVVDAHRGQAGVGAHASEVCPRYGAAINAGFFNDPALLTPVGLVIAGGQRVHAQHQDDGWGLFLYHRRRAEILPGTARVPAGVTEAVECKPRLVSNGSIPTFKPQLATRRSAVALDGHGHLFFAATDGDLSLEAWAACLRDGLGCRDALNLDGGPSTQLAIHGKVNYVLPGPKMPVFLTVSSK